MNVIVAYIIVAIIGVVMLCFPEALYTLTIGWKFNSRDGSPRSYRIIARICGVVMILAGVFGIVAEALA